LILLHVKKEYLEPFIIGQLNANIIIRLIKCLKSILKGVHMSQDLLIRNHVKVKGNGTRPIIFAPGFGCDQSVWALVTGAFEENYKIIL
jgi:hypothetical protein